MKTFDEIYKEQSNGKDFDSDINLIKDSLGKMFSDEEYEKVKDIINNVVTSKGENISQWDQIKRIQETHIKMLSLLKGVEVTDKESVKNLNLNLLKLAEEAKGNLVEESDEFKKLDAGIKSAMESMSNDEDTEVQPT